MIEYFDKAIDNGDVWVAYKLANHYYAKKNYVKALELYIMCSSNENMYRSEAYYKAGEMYETGLGTNMNMSNAIQYYHKSVEYATEIECDARLALIRLNQQVEDPTEFVDISKSLLVGMTPQEMYEKGLEYEQGKNNRAVSLPKAYGYYKAAADKNYTKSYAKMGEIYISEFYPFKDKAKSDKYYEKAYKIFKQSETTDPEACYQLGMMHKYGRSVSINTELAMNYFKTAVAKGHVDANYEIGLMYQVELEHTDAFNYFMKAADGGNAKAMFEVAKAYETGIGTSRSKNQAISWYTKCAKSKARIANDAQAALDRLCETNEVNEKE